MEDFDLINKFQDYLFAIRNYSEYTINNYVKDIRDFQSFIREYKFARNLVSINNSRVCHNYISEMVRKGYSATSVNRKISSLRTFYNYLLGEKLVTNNFFKEIHNVKTPKKLPSFIDEDEIMMLIESIDITSDLGYRNRILIELLYATGMRVSEVCGLLVPQIDLANQTIQVMGKGKKERIVMMYPDLADELRHYLMITRSNLLAIGGDLNNRYVFINYKGGALTPRGVRKILNTLIDKCALNKHLSPHMIRHSFATSLLNHGVDLRSVQELLGHENLSTTQIYTHITTENVKIAFNDAFPRAKKSDNHLGDENKN